MGKTKLDGDFAPVEFRIYTSKKKKENMDYAVVAIDSMNKVAAVGKDAYRYYDPVNHEAINGFEVYSTMKRNVIADYTSTVFFLRWLMKTEISGIKVLMKPTVGLCVPFELTQVETKAFEDAFYQAGAKKVTILNQEYEANKIFLAQSYDLVIGVIPNKLENTVNQVVSYSED